MAEVDTPAADEAAAFLAICREEREPDPEHYAAGRAAWGVKQFHEGPRPLSSIKALSWRIGWNSRALEERD